MQGLQLWVWSRELIVVPTNQGAGSQSSLRHLGSATGCKKTGDEKIRRKNTDLPIFQQKRVLYEAVEDL